MAEAHRKLFTEELSKLNDFSLKKLVKHHNLHFHIPLILPRSQLIARLADFYTYMTHDHILKFKDQDFEIKNRPFKLDGEPLPPSDTKAEKVSHMKKTERLKAIHTKEDPKRKGRGKGKKKDEAEPTTKFESTGRAVKPQVYLSEKQLAKQYEDLEPEPDKFTKKDKGMVEILNKTHKADLAKAGRKGHLATTRYTKGLNVAAAKEVARRVEKIKEAKKEAEYKKKHKYEPKISQAPKKK